MAISFAAHTQPLRGLGNLIKAKATQKVAGEVEKKVDGLLNGSPVNRQGAKENEKSDGNDAFGKKSSQLNAYSRYDFVTGDKVTYFDDFSNAATGKLMVGWNASGKAEVVTLEGFKGKWLRMFPGSMYLSANVKPLGENYTVEFDVIMNGTPPSGTKFLPDFVLGLLSTGKFSTTHNSFLESGTTINNKLQLVISPM